MTASVEQLDKHPRFTKSELGILYQLISNPQVSFPAHQGHHARGVLEKLSKALDKPLPDEQ